MTLESETEREGGIRLRFVEEQRFLFGVKELWRNR